MKILEKKSELCTYCRACESECSRTWFKEDNPEKSCIRITQDHIITCSQCGECINVCPVQAISRDSNGVVRIKKSICVGCFMCVGFCPESAMSMSHDYLEPFKCVACGQCAKKCPGEAIYLVQEG
jgi:carbon-monoxide dehydrogenase iron sulfur subunit